MTHTQVMVLKFFPQFDLHVCTCAHVHSDRNVLTERKRKREINTHPWQCLKKLKAAEHRVVSEVTMFLSSLLSQSCTKSVDQTPNISVD